MPKYFKVMLRYFKLTLSLYALVAVLAAMAFVLGTYIYLHPVAIIPFAFGFFVPVFYKKFGRKMLAFLKKATNLPDETLRNNHRVAH